MLRERALTQHSFIFQLAMLHGISPFFPEILRFVGIVTVALARELTTKFRAILTTFRKGLALAALA